jgi:hypothetical protein
VATTDLETAIASFLELGRRLQAVHPLTAEAVLDQLATWYHRTRIDGADLDQDADMLLLQWGATRPLTFSEPTDLRNLSDDDLQFADHELRYLNFTRQVFAAAEEQDAEFDDSAVHMSITLGFDAANGTERASNLWIHTPDGIESGKQQFRGTPFVHSLLNVTPQSVTITVGLCG